MSYWTDIEIEKLELKIPKKDFPLESDVIVGCKFPCLRFFEDESEDTSYEFNDEDKEFIYFKLNDKFGRYNYETPIEELKDLCVKYKGTLILKANGEDDDTEYVRVKDGKVKTVKIIEEDE